MLRIRQTPEVELQGGQANITNYTFYGNFGRKFFILDNDGTSTIILTISLTNGPGSGGFQLFPADSGITDEINVFIAPGETTSFSVDYNSEWGDSQTASIEFSQPVVSSAGIDLYSSTSAITSINFSHETNIVVTKRDLGPLFSEDEDGNYQVEQAGDPISEDETSFGLIRTNPKLTGNVKLTVDSSGEIWLNSIDAVKELADDRFKKFRIGRNGSYASDLNKFFDYGDTPPELVFSLYQLDSQYTSTKRTLSEQYDRFYQYGVSSLKSKFYDEQFSFFAPLYMKQKLPQYFVIFRTDGPINKFTYDLPFDEWKTKVTSDILSQSQIVKVYDLGETTPIGQYLRNIVNHPSRTESDLTVSYQKDGYTSYNGIAYTEGSFVQAGELLYDYFNQENPLISVEEFVSLGFERNKVISSHVINMEFLFNDDEAKDYSINRYFGLYVDTLDLASFTISEGGLQAFSLDLGQTPLPRKGVDGNKVSQKPFIQTNPNGISIFAETESIKNSLTPKAFTSVVSSFTSDVNNVYVELPGDYGDKIAQGEEVLLYTGSGVTASGPVSSLNVSDVSTLLTLDITGFTSSVSISLLNTLGNQLKCNFYTDAKLALYKQKIFDNTFVENTPRFFYVKDNDNNLHSVKSTEIRQYNIDPFNEKTVVQINLKEEQLDMSTLGGFSSLLTQADAKVLDTVGRASLSVEFTDFMEPNDYLEVSWSPGPTAEYPLRWRAVANTTGLSAGQSWPSTSISSDSLGDYYISYFHPGDSSIKLEDFVRSIADAFNKFPFKDFEVLSKGSELLFRSTQTGLNSQTALLELSVTNFAFKVMGIPGSESISQVNFIGGSNRKNTRARLDRSIAEGMLTTEYVSTNGSFSLLRKYTVLGKEIIFAPYVEEPIYDENGEKLIDFVDSEKYMTVCIEDEKQPIQLTSDKRLTTYQLFEPTYGVLSVMPMRDFDTDFFFSDYTKSYTPELIEYFGRFAPAAKIVSMTTGTPPVVVFDKSFEFETYPYYTPFLTISESGIDPAVLHNQDGQFKFDAPGPTATYVTVNSVPYTPSIGDTILMMPDKKALYFTDLELAKFKGFLSLSGVISSQDEEEFQRLENQWDPTRFTFQLLNSEYDRLAENYLKSLVLKSRVVPYVTKWVSPQGKDIRDNQYRFNYHRSFGNMNFSPSAEMNIPDPRYHTHEWPYLDAVPDSYPIQTFPEYAFSYMFDHLSDKYNFGSLKRDWFLEYFTAGFPTEKYMDTNGDFISAKIDPSERYAYFNYQDYNDTTTALFRGYRFSIKEIDTNGAPVNLSTKYNNYRFSAIIETEEDDSFTFEEPVVFNTVVNEKWKFILLKITVKTSSFRYSQGRLKYTDLYTLSNNDEIATYTYDSGFSTYLPGFIEAIPTDRKITTPINFGGFSSDSTLLSNYLYFDTLTLPIDTYLEDLREEVVPLKSGIFSNLVSVYESGILYKTLNLISPPAQVYSDRTIEIQSPITYTKVSSSAILTPSAFPLSSIPWGLYTSYHVGGGNSSFQGMRDRISFAEILNVMTGVSDKSTMRYDIYKEDGSVVHDANFIITPIAPESLTRIYDYYPEVDEDKPQEFFSIPVIGSILQQQKDLQTIYRYQGNFSPKFRDVLKFWLREDNLFTNITSKDFLLKNTHMGEELINFSLLKNQYYAKVADSEVLSLSASSGYSPVYPLIDEISIDKKDEFAWSSSWDQNYYRKYSSSSDYAALKGTVEMTEVKSFFGSKAMKTPQQYDLYEFKILQVPVNSNLKTYIGNEFSYYENDTTAYLQVDVYERLMREMLGTSNDLRAKEEFMKAMNIVPESFDPALLDDYVKLYLRNNILDLFEINEVKLYVLQTGDPGGISSVTPLSEERPLIEFNITDNGETTLTESQLSQRGYFIKKDAKISSLSNLAFQVTYPLDSRFFTSLSIGVTVKRI